MKRKLTLAVGLFILAHLTLTGCVTVPQQPIKKEVMVQESSFGPTLDLVSYSSITEKEPEIEPELGSKKTTKVVKATKKKSISSVKPTSTKKVKATATKTKKVTKGNTYGKIKIPNIGINLSIRTQGTASLQDIVDLDSCGLIYWRDSKPVVCDHADTKLFGKIKNCRQEQKCRL